MINFSGIGKHQDVSICIRCIFFARSVYEQYHLGLSLSFAMHKIKPDTLTAGAVKINFKGTIEKFFASDNACLFMSSVKGTPAY